MNRQLSLAPLRRWRRKKSYYLLVLNKVLVGGSSLRRCLDNWKKEKYLWFCLTDCLILLSATAIWCGISWAVQICYRSLLKQENMFVFPWNCLFSRSPVKMQFRHRKDPFTERLHELIKYPISAQILGPKCSKSVLAIVLFNKAREDSDFCQKCLWFFSSLVSCIKSTIWGKKLFFSCSCLNNNSGEKVKIVQAKSMLNWIRKAWSMPKKQRIYLFLLYSTSRNSLLQEVGEVFF